MVKVTLSLIYGLSISIAFWAAFRFRKWAVFSYAFLILGIIGSFLVFQNVFSIVILYNPIPNIMLILNQFLLLILCAILAKRMVSAEIFYRFKTDRIVSEMVSKFKVYIRQHEPSDEPEVLAKVEAWAPKPLLPHISGKNAGGSYKDERLDRDLLHALFLCIFHLFVLYTHYLIKLFIR